MIKRVSSVTIWHISIICPSRSVLATLGIIFTDIWEHVIMHLYVDLELHGCTGYNSLMVAKAKCVKGLIHFWLSADKPLAG